MLLFQLNLVILFLPQYHCCCCSSWITTSLNGSTQLNSPMYSNSELGIFICLLLVFQLRDLEMSHHYEDRSSESTFRDSRSHSQDNSEPPDLPMPTCFRSRSHSYLRAIQAGCSQDDDTASVDSGCSPPLVDNTVRTYSTSTGESHTHSRTHSTVPLGCLNHTTTSI